MPLRNIREFIKNPPANRTIGDDLAELKKLGLVDTEGVGKGAQWFISKKEH